MQSNGRTVAGEGRHTGRRGSRWPELLLAAVAVVLALLGAELGLHVYGFSYLNLTHADEITGYSLRPGAEGWYREEGESYVRVGRDGFRDYGHEKEKSPGTFRVAMLGDSFTVAWEVPTARTFTAVAEQSLRSCRHLPASQVEVLNFGVGGHGTAQELLTLRHRVWEYEPDFVVVAVYTANDVHNNSRMLEDEPLRPYFVRSNGDLELDNSFLRSGSFRARTGWIAQIAYEAVDSSRLIQLLAKSKNVWLRRLLVSKHRDARPPSNELPGLIEWVSYDEASAYREPTDPHWIEAWAVTEELLRALHQEVHARSRGFLLVTLSNPVQVYPDPEQRAAAMARLQVSDLFYPDRRIRSLADREGIPLLTLAARLQQHADRHRVFLHGFPNTRLGVGHWNAEGHRLAGQLIAEAICEGIQSSPRPEVESADPTHEDPVVSRTHRLGRTGGAVSGSGHTTRTP